MKNDFVMTIGNEKIKVHCAYDELVEVSEIAVNPQNPNKHPEEQIKLLCEIYSGNGIRSPIVISNLSKQVVKGHGRLMAAQRLGLKHFPVDYQDYESADHELADLIADNRISELSMFDMSPLKDQLINLDSGAFNMNLTGFDNAALERMMTAMPPEEPIQKDLSSQIESRFAVMVECDDETVQKKVFDTCMCLPNTKCKLLNL